MITKELLEQLYTQDRCSIQKISKKLGCSVGYVFSKLKLFDIPTNKYSKAWNSGLTYHDDNRILAGKNHPRIKNIIYYNSDFKHLKKKLLLNAKCQICGNKASLIHHKNKNIMDNNLENLQPLCNSCHTILHNKENGVFKYEHNCDWCGKKIVVYGNRQGKQKCCSLSCKAKKHYYNNKNNSIRLRNNRKKDAKD
jgi:hypothetical protein